jgi:plastocyanin
LSRPWRAFARHIVVTLALIGAVVSTAPPVPIEGHTAATGGVHGQIDIVTKSSRRLATAGSYPGRTVALPAARPSSELQNVVVFVDTNAPEPTPPMRVVMRQDHEEFVPHVVAVTVGSTVEFPNGDLVFHNVFSLSSAATFDLGRYPRNTSKARTFMKPGLVKVFCHLHSHMSAVVRVFAHPHFAVPDAAGRVSLEGLPAGRHVVAAWHERVGEVRREVNVVAGESATVSLSLPLTDDASPGEAGHRNGTSREAEPR